MGSVGIISPHSQDILIKPDVYNQFSVCVKDSLQGRTLNGQVNLSQLDFQGGQKK